MTTDVFILYFYVCDQKRVLDVLELRWLGGTWVLGTGLPSSVRAASTTEPSLQPQFPIRYGHALKEFLC